MSIQKIVDQIKNIKGPNNLSLEEKKSSRKKY
jgi:hypothetical protein